MVKQNEKDGASAVSVPPPIYCTYRQKPISRVQISLYKQAVGPMKFSFLERTTNQNDKGGHPHTARVKQKNLKKNNDRHAL